MSVRPNLTREDWIHAAQQVLVKGGVDAGRHVTRSPSAFAEAVAQILENRCNCLAPAVVACHDEGPLGPIEKGADRRVGRACSCSKDQALQ